MSEWSPIPSFPGYFATREGDIGSDKVRCDCKAKRLRPPGIRMLRSGLESRSRNYLKVVLRRDGRSFTMKVHQLVLETFVGPKPAGGVCRHLDGDPANNRLENLRWGTVAENARDAMRHGTSPYYAMCTKNAERNGRSTGTNPKGVIE